MCILHCELCIALVFCYYLFVIFNVIFPLVFCESYSCTRVLVQLTCHHVLKVVTPDNAVFLHFIDMIFDELNNRESLVFWIFKETKKKFHRTVSGSTSHSAVCSVKEIYAVTTAFNCVCEGKLHVVMSVNTDCFSVFISGFCVNVSYSSHSFRVY